MSTCILVLTRRARGLESVDNAVRLLRAGDVRDSSLRSGMGDTSGGGHAEGGHSDTTGDTATRQLGSPSVRAEEAIDRALTAALDALTRFDLECGKAFRAPKDPRPVQKPMDGCTSCVRDGGAWEPVSENTPGKGLCRWCADFLRNYGRRPPVELVAMHRQGRKVSTADVARTLGQVDA